jgi:non-heme chloroperoxidase
MASTITGVTKPRALDAPLSNAFGLRAGAGLAGPPVRRRAPAEPLRTSCGFGDNDLEMPYLELRDGVPLFYEVEGDGLPIVLVPGWTLTTRFWERQVEDLARDHRVVTLDLRGAGRSGKTPQGHSLSGYADDLAELFQHLELSHATLVAYAMGVSVSVHYLVAHGFARVAGFVWVDHSPRFYVAPDWPYALFGDLTPQGFDETIRLLGSDRPAATRAMLDVMFQDPAEWMYAELMKTPTEVAATMLALVATTDLRPLVPQLDVPTLLVNGKQSVVPCEVAGWLEEHLPKARRIVLERAGHGPFWDDPAGFNRAVREFSAQFGPGTR